MEYRDLGQRGLILRVEASGLKVWWARYWHRGRDARFRLGTHPELSLKAARAAARQTLGDVSRGTDPQTERARLRAGETVAEVVATWLADDKLGPAARWRGGLDGGTARSILPHVRRLVHQHGASKLTALTARDCERFCSRPETAATRNRSLTALRLLFAWAKRKGLLEADPSAAQGKERESERSRTLTDPELRALIVGFDGTRYGRAVRLLALTGLRRDEVLGARWSWLDVENGVLTIPPEAEKTGEARGEPRRVALSRQAVALLADQRSAMFAEGVRSGFIFATSTGERPHPDALKPTLNRLRGRRSNGQPASTDKRAKPRRAVLASDLTIHDIRRTVADGLLNRLKVAPWVVDHVVLGHRRPKLLRTYMPSLPLAEAREALERWAELLDGVVSADEAATPKV